MPEITLEQTDGRTARDLVHVRMSSTPASATVADVRAFFAGSANRRLAVLADEDGRVAGVLVPADVVAADPSEPARGHARNGPTVAADAPAAVARDAALATDTRRIPVVEADGTLVGVVAVDEHERYFCGTGIGSA